MAATKALFLLGLIALFAVATARSDEENVAGVVSGVVPTGPRALLTYKWDFDFHSYGHQKYILYKKFYEKDEEEEECHDCDEEDNDKCYKKVYYRICYLKHNHKRCDCKKTHKTRYYVVKYKKTKCH